MHKAGMIIVWGIFFVVMMTILTSPSPSLAKRGIRGGVRLGGVEGEGGVKDIPKEPDFSSPAYLDWDILSGHAPLIQALFDLDQDGKPEYYTLRKIISSDSIRGTKEEALIQIALIYEANPNTQLFFSPSGIEGDLYIVYIAEKYPLFYCLDNIIWIDRDEDGLNGNEEIYFGPADRKIKLNLITPPLICLCVSARRQVPLFGKEGEGGVRVEMTKSGFKSIFSDYPMGRYRQEHDRGF